MGSWSDQPVGWLRTALTLCGASSMAVASALLGAPVAGATGTPPTIATVNGGAAIVANGALQTIAITGAHLAPLARSNAVQLLHGSSSIALRVLPGATASKIRTTAAISATSPLIGTDTIKVATSGGVASTSVVVSALPVVTSVTPSALVKGENATITLSGSGFSSDDVLTSTRSVTFSNVVASPDHTTLTATASVKASATTKSQAILVGNPTISAKTNNNHVALSIGALPHFAGLPGSASAGPGASYAASLVGLPTGETPTSIALGGGGDASFDLSGGSGCALVASTWSCNGQITVQDAATPAVRTVTVSYADGSTVSIPNGFRVTPLSVGGAAGFKADGQPHAILIEGSGFVATGSSPADQPQVTISPVGGSSRAVTVFSAGYVSYSKITALVEAPPGAEGIFSVTVTDPGHGGTATGAGVLTVVSAPSITGATMANGSPISSVPNDGQPHSVVLSGADLHADAMVTSSTTGVSMSQTSFDDAAQTFTETITVDPSVAPGTPIDLTVANGDAGTFSSDPASPFLTVSAVPAVTSASVATVPNDGSAHSVVLSMSGIQSGATVTTTAAGITLGTPSIDPTAQTVTMDVTAGSSTATPGESIPLVITNPDGGVGTFSDLLSTSAVPAVTSASVATVPNDGSAHSVVLSMSGIQSGATVTTTADGITLGTPSIDHTAQTLTVDVTADSTGSTPGKQIDLTITNPDGGSVTEAASSGLLTVSAPPTIVSSSFLGVVPGVAAHLLVSGTGFVSGSTFTSTTPGISIVTNSVDATAGTAWITVTPSTSAGFSNGDPVVLVVTNPDGGVGTSSDLLSVTMTPHLLSADQSVITRGTSPLEMTVSGSFFQSNTRFLTMTPGFSVTLVSVDVAAQTAVIDVTISPGANPRSGSAVALTVMNPAANQSPATLSTNNALLTVG